MQAQVSVPVGVGPTTLPGDLAVPDDAPGVVAFAHGSGSSRHSPRNRQVAAALREAGLATLLTDLLTAEEAAQDADTGRWRFDIDLLGRRVTAVVDWLGRHPTTRGLSVGLFGASTGSAAALVAAARRADTVRAVVSRGGRPDLAGAALPRVRAPALLLVGGRDERVLALNQRAAASLGGPHRLQVVPDATHLFEEPGALERVAEHACGWFRDTLAGPAAGEWLTLSQ